VIRKMLALPNEKIARIEIAERLGEIMDEGRIAGSSVSRDESTLSEG